MSCRSCRRTTTYPVMIPMCDFHTNARLDPTRTLGIRRRFEADLYRRFRRLKGLIREALIEDQGLSTNAVEPGRFDFPTSAGKVEAFMSWLREQEVSGEIAIKRRPGRATGQREWADIYVDSAYQRGIRRARAELRKRGVDVPDDADRAFNQPFHADRVGMIYSRVYSELDGITEAMDQQISRVLAEGITEGRNPLEIARRINNRVDKIGITRARLLARTEVIRAHHSANIQEYRKAGVEGVDVQAEWVTAGDGRVCSRCRAMEGRVFSIDEIEGMIPLHPSCRCVATPRVE